MEQHKEIFLCYTKDMEKIYCKTPECSEEAQSRNMCRRCYGRWYAQGGRDEIRETKSRPKVTCQAEEGCDRDSVTRELCPKHYQRLRNTGSTTIPNPRLRTARERFEAYTEWTEDGCLEWIGGRSKDGYGSMTFRKKSWKPHRVAWTIMKGEIPEGLFVNHVCWNRACVNIDHLNLATPSENVAYQKGTVSTNKTGFRNVFWCASSQSYSYEIIKDGKGHRKVGFSTPEEASREAEELKERLFGEFAGRPQ